MNNKTALLIVDVQVAMFSYEDTELYNKEKVLDNIYTLLQKARLTNTPVIFVQHTGKDSDEFGKEKSTWKIHPRVKPLETETIVEKKTWDSFYKTDLNYVLKKQEISKLVIAGMQTEFCIDTTCRRAFSMGYENILVKDAHSTFDSQILDASKIIEHHNNVLGGRFVELKTADEIHFTKA
ncbi:cysteine hydrolase family protein [Tepidibacter hydrothermalis]|uniref:Cysteine hydrolase family protein n=1 Tax=Tepidibacter hydrothermalis TaxID=3036126 RepID=A0ABY8E913_9FIRM|nr:cysteine hydrolase family protein [Tepidibacter hydrothermalis]WFD09395.1 cysteine hydrolase family protein [Tepidibacter hydrothermalis]